MINKIDPKQVAPIDEIVNFLTSRSDYSYGLQLLNKVHKNKRLVFNLSKKENHKNWDKLCYELKKFVIISGVSVTQVLSKELPPEIKEKPSVELPTLESSKKIKDSSVITPVKNRQYPLLKDVNDEELLEKTKQKRIRLMRKRGSLHGALQEASKDERRYELAIELSELQKELDKCHKAVKEGEITKDIVLENMSAQEHQKYKNLLSYVSKYKTKVNSAKNDTERERAQKHLDNYQAELKAFNL